MAVCVYYRVIVQNVVGRYEVVDNGGEVDHLDEALFRWGTEQVLGRVVQ